MEHLFVAAEVEKRSVCDRVAVDKWVVMCWETSVKRGRCSAGAIWVSAGINSILQESALLRHICKAWFLFVCVEIRSQALMQKWSAFL